jgi:two-component system chemotaxis sensor kinase CheA
MNTKDHEFLKTLRATFKVEAAEHLQAIATGLLELEKTPAPEVQRSLVETVFRAAHSRSDYLKGVTAEHLVVLDVARILADPKIIVHNEVEN